MVRFQWIYDAGKEELEGVSATKFHIDTISTKITSLAFTFRYTFIVENYLVLKVYLDNYLVPSVNGGSVGEVKINYKVD